MRYEPPSKQIVYEYGDAGGVLDRALRDFWIGQAILITDAASCVTPLAKTIASMLKDRLSDQIEGFAGQVARPSIMRVTRALRSREIDAAVVFGDSALIDMVKAARICLTNNVADEPDMERLRFATTAATPRPYLIAIPSDAGPAPYSMQLDLPGENGRPGFVLRHQDLAADVVILSPEATAHVGVEDLVLGARDSLAHALAAQDGDVPRPVLAAAQYGRRCLVESAGALRRADDARARGAFLGGAWMAAQPAACGAGLPDRTHQSEARAILSATKDVPLEGDERWK